MANYLNELLKSKNRHELALAVVFALFIIFNVQMPRMVVENVSTLTGHIVVSVVAIVLLMRSNAIVGLLGIVVAYLLLERSNQQSGKHTSVARVVEKEMEKVDRYFTSKNQFPKTLEEEMVELRTNHKSQKDLIPPSYKPVLNPSLEGTTSV